MIHLKNSQFLAKDLILVISAIFIGILSYLLSNKIQIILPVGHAVANLFLKFLQLISAPIVFLAIITNFLSIAGQQHLRFYSKRALFYTILTTIIAATVAAILFQIINPNSTIINSSINHLADNKPNYLQELFKIFPDNIINAFVQNNIIGVAIIAAILGLGMMKLPNTQQIFLNEIFTSLFQTFINIAKFIILILPIGVWSFSLLFCQAVANNTISLNGLGKYALIILSANLIQACIVLPILLKSKNLSAKKLFNSVYPALTVAFFSKSSSATLPMTIDCMIKRHNIDEELSKFVLPICTIINMNGCAAFIYTTVLFVASQSGIELHMFDYIVWILIATLIAVGNASVPMGCYFLSSVMIIGLGAPLTIMGLILPMYTFFDMIETAVNVWSDCCVTDIVAIESSKIT